MLTFAGLLIKLSDNDVRIAGQTFAKDKDMIFMKDFAFAQQFD